MTPTLSSADQIRTASCSRVLSAPFDYPSFEAWSTAAANAIESAIGAEHASLAIRQQSQLRTYADSIRPEVLSTYFLQTLPNNERDWGMESRQLSLGAWSRRETWGERLRDMYRSAYWHELMVPNRAFDTVGLSVAGGRDSVAHFQFYHGRPTGRRFGERGVAMLRALYGPFAGGIRSWMALATHHQELARVADAIPSGLIFATMDARIVHENVAAKRILAEAKDRTHVREEIVGTVRRIAAAFAQRSHVHYAGGNPLSQSNGGTSTTPSGNYRLSVSVLNTALLCDSASFVVILERTGPPPFPSDLIKQRYRLTGREIEVVELLAAGLTNSEIAGRMGVSTHTAHHHTESVMMKLSLHSRAQIPALVRSIRDGDLEVSIAAWDRGRNRS